MSRSAPTKAEMQRTIDQLNLRLRAEQEQHNETRAAHRRVVEEIEAAEAKSEKGRFARKWQKRLTKALGLADGEDWDVIEREIETLRENSGRFDDLPFAASDGPAIAELLDGLGIHGARLLYVLGAVDPVAALKVWS